MDAKSLLLTTALRHSINEPNIEAGFERFRAVTGDHADYPSFCDAVAACLREGLIREPIRLPEGALQCHWHLELTSKGVEATRALLQQLSLRGGAADEAISVKPCAHNSTEIASSRRSSQ
jgi:hypothetical protein